MQGHGWLQIAGGDWLQTAEAPQLCRSPSPAEAACLKQASKPGISLLAL